MSFNDGSRIRAPARVDYSRDVVQVKGGSSDYYVVGEIDFLTLRNEQRRARSPSSRLKQVEADATFKPIPIGFEMSERRHSVVRREGAGGRRKSDKQKKVA